MAGKGPAPKPQKARRNAEVVPMRVVEAAPAVQPDLPEFDVQVTVEGVLESARYEWPEMTRNWWRMLALHPLVGEFTEIDWQFLLDTARIHAAFWEGNLKLAPELRLREAKYGFTPEDRLRLRLSFAQTDEAEDRVKRRREQGFGSGARERRGGFTG